MVYGVAEQLWRKMTGIRTHWLPNDPQFNQAQQTLEIEMSRLEKMGTNDPQAVMQQLRRVENASFELQKGAWNPSVTVRHAIAVVFLVLALLVLLFAMSVNR